jgi:D-glycero-D-manno-heptose 1,7-bisphosphate phosphatase
MTSRAAFLDRDGVINLDHGYVWRREEFEFVPGTLAACAQLARRGFALVVVTNQSGIGRGMYAEADFEHLTAWMRERFSDAGAPLAGVYFCPHHPTDAAGSYLRACACRKPAPGMLLQAAAKHGLDLARSVMFGDTCDDLEAARAAGVPQRVLLGKDGRALPQAACADGLVGARFASLADAVIDSKLSRALEAGAAP